MKKFITIIFIVTAVLFGSLLLYNISSTLENNYDTLDAADRQNLEEKFNHSSVVLVVEMQQKTNKDTLISGEVKVIEVIRNTDVALLKENAVIKASFYPNHSVPQERFVFFREQYTNQKVLLFGWFEKIPNVLRAYTGYMIAESVNSGMEHMYEVEKQHGLAVKRELGNGAKRELAFLRKLAQAQKKMK